jgi:DNA mismatch endonuclease, patch repair protein
MRATPGKNNPRELTIRSALHRSGLRFRVGYPIPDAPRRSIDICFTRQRIAVFLDGCFWHGCPEHGSTPKANREWWLKKIQANQQRDADTNLKLRNAGWTVLRFWEHESLEDVVSQIMTHVSAVNAPI